MRFFSMFLILLGPFLAQAAQWAVPEDVPSVRQALQRAAPGDEIILADEVFSERIVISKPVRIIGHRDATLDGAGGRHAVAIQAQGVFIDGLTVRNADTCIKVNRGAGVTLAGVTVEDCDLGVRIAGQLLLRQSTITDGVAAVGRGTFAILDNDHDVVHVDDPLFPVPDTSAPAHLRFRAAPPGPGHNEM